MTDTLGSIGTGTRVGPGDLVIFDLDGTLTDSADGIVASFRHALHTVGAAVPDGDLVARIVGEGGKAPRQWAGLKFFNVYGPNEYHKGDMRSVVAKIYPVAAAGEKARLFESHHPDFEHGGQSRDFVYVADCVRVILWLLAHPEVSGVFNLGTGQARSFKDLATAVYQALGAEPQLEYVPTPVEIRDKYQYFTQADMSRLREAGYTEGFTSLEDGIRDYVQNYLHTDDPYV